MDDSQDIVIVVFGLEKVFISYFSCFTYWQGITLFLILEFWKLKVLGNSTSIP